MIIPPEDTKSSNMKTYNGAKSHHTKVSFTKKVPFSAVSIPSKLPTHPRPSPEKIHNRDNSKNEKECKRRKCLHDESDSNGIIVKSIKKKSGSQNDMGKFLTDILYGGDKKVLGGCKHVCSPEKVPDATMLKSDLIPKRRKTLGDGK